MSDNEDVQEEFDEGAAGGEGKVGGHTRPKKASAFRKGDFILLKDHPCKVSAMSTSKTGKHGHAKVKFTGYDIFTGKKYEELQGSTHNMEEVICKKTTYLVVDVDGTQISVLDEESAQKDGLALPASDDEQADLAKVGHDVRSIWKDIQGGKEARDLHVTVTAAMGQEQVQAYNMQGAA